MKTFDKDQNRVVIKSDKGNCIVVLGKSIYYKIWYQYFSDQNFTKSINDNENKYKTKVSSKIKKNSGSIDETFYKSVSPYNFRTLIAYFLPKHTKLIIVQI